MATVLKRPKTSILAILLAGILTLNHGFSLERSSESMMDHPGASPIEAGHTGQGASPEPDFASPSPDGRIRNSIQQRQYRSAVGEAPRLPPPSTLVPGTRLTRGTVIRVGPDRLYRKPSEAATVAKDGDTVEIDATVFVGDVAVWHQNNLTLKGVGGRAHLKAGGRSAEGKAIWVVKGDDTTIENVEFSGTRVRHLNGAGIRLEGRNLTLRHCSIHDNEMGILTGRNPESDIIIESCEFNNNTVDYEKYNRVGHNIYIGNVRTFKLINSYVHGAAVGHNVKTRARTNIILNNRIMDERDGGSSYLIDLSNGGTSYVIGNLFHQSPENNNQTMISYGAEGFIHPGRDLYVINNTFVNDDTSGVFIRSYSNFPARILNNLFVGRGDRVRGPDGLHGNGAFVGNVQTDTPHFLDRTNFDYRITRESPAIDRAVDPGSVRGIDLTPTNIYVHPAGAAPRPRRGALDAGAYEFVGD